MRELIKSKEYNFLRDNPKLGDNIILLTMGGSYAYGTNVATSKHISDIDLRGVYLNSKKELLLMSCHDKPYENKALDVVVYPLKQMIGLLKSCNPNTLELLGTREEDIFILTREGKMLRDNSELFLSRKAYSSFGGYALQQLRRLENALARDSYPQKEKEKHILKSIEKQMMTFTDRYSEICQDELKLYIDNSLKEELDDEIYIDINLKKYPLRDLKGMYGEMSQVIRDYDKLNHRNSKKDEVHLLKHAMHLVRLLKMGTEIMEGKGINTYRYADREELLRIRSGKISYEEIFAMVDKLESDFKYAYSNTLLPDKPDEKRINDLVMEINKCILMK